MENTDKLLKSTLSSAENKPLVSVVITTKNEEKHIEACLESIVNQSYKNLEIIIVDDFSTDKTTEIAKKFNARTYIQGNERSFGRNYGAKMACGTYILYIDADMMLTSNVITECVEKCGEQNAGALYIPEVIVGQGFWIKVRNFERSFYTGTVVDAVRFMHRYLFLQVQGFDETLVGAEDWDLDRRIRKIAKVDMINAPLRHNEGSFNLSKYLMKKNYYTKGIQNYLEKWGVKDTEVKKQVGAWYRIVGVFIEHNKWKKLVKHPFLVVAMYVLRFRVALIFLLNRQ